MLGIPASDIEGVATFYSLIFRRPVGRHVIKICDSVACFLTGYDELKDAFVKHLKADLGQTTAGRPFHAVADLLSGGPVTRVRC